MEMRASQDVGMGQNLTPPLLPLAFSLYDSTLLSHCSACFSRLPPPPNHFPLLPTSSLNSHPLPNPSVLYCSLQCSKADSDLHLSSAEYHLLHSHPAAGSDKSDLRAALRLLRRFELLDLVSNERLDRIGGLLSNRDQLMSCRNGGAGDRDVLERIKDGAKAMAMARGMRDGLDSDYSVECVLEEAVLCVVLTNAVEVQVNGGPAVGIAVYNTTFSWINHSCSPNACYYFPPQKGSNGESQLCIVPATMGGGCISDDGIEAIENDDSIKVAEDYGPRIIVRSIKAINKGDEVSVAYTDVLQPKAMRQSELCFKYRFVCSCCRCSAWPPTYVDQTLQEIFSVNCNCANLSSDNNFYRDEALKKLTGYMDDCNCANLSSDHNLYRDEALKRLTGYMDDAITDYLTFGNPKSCCEKLENLLTHGLLEREFEPKGEQSKQQFWLHPLHHLSLNAYTTLASAYKVYASDLLAMDPEMDKLQMEAFDMSRTSAAYSLLLAGATHHLFLSESSLFSSVANFWASAGESLINVAKSTVWKLFEKWGLASAELPSFSSFKYCKCALVDKFEQNFAFSQAQNVVFEDISKEFLDCIRTITPKVWTSLIHHGCYLKLIEDPIDFRWIGDLKSFRALRFEANFDKVDAESSVSRGEALRWLNQDSIDLFQLGVHCLLYGNFLSSIFLGKQSNLAHCITNLLNG